LLAQWWHRVKYGLDSWTLGLLDPLIPTIKEKKRKEKKRRRRRKKENTLNNEWRIKRKCYLQKLFKTHTEDLVYRVFVLFYELVTVLIRN